MTDTKVALMNPDRAINNYHLLERALVAAQVALIEIDDGYIPHHVAVAAMETILKEIGVRFKVLKKEYAQEFGA